MDEDRIDIRAKHSSARAYRGKGGFQRLYLELKYPRPDGRSGKIKTQQLDRWGITCLSESAVAHVRACLREALKDLDCTRLISPRSPLAAVSPAKGATPEATPH
jgi:hypothetical protein